MSKAYLILSDGSVFEGTSFGAPVSAVGELVFTTGVVGYLETLTDPAYAGQIILQTFPAIGNYGVIEEDFDGEFHASGYVVHEWCDTPSNFRAQYDIDRLLKDQGIPGICGVDTRALTRRLRDHGPLNAMISDEIPSDLTALKEYKITGAVEKVTCAEAIAIPGDGKHAVVLDCGAKPSIVTALAKRGCRVTIVPADTSAEEIAKVIAAQNVGEPFAFSWEQEKQEQLNKSGVKTSGFHNTAPVTIESGYDAFMHGFGDYDVVADTHHTSRVSYDASADMWKVEYMWANGDIHATIYMNGQGITQLTVMEPYQE